MTWTRRSTAWGMLLALTATLAACGGSGDGGTDPDPDNDPPPTDDPVQTTSVRLEASSFDPPAITVAPGATVTWTWDGGVEHNVTWASGDLSNSPTQTSGTFQQTMPETEGELVYYCSIHGSSSGGMRGTIEID